MTKIETMIKEKVGGPEFLFGIVSYNGKRFPRYSGRKYFIHINDYLEEVLEKQGGFLTSEDLNSFANELYRREFSLGHCHVLAEAREFPSYEDLGTLELIPGDSQNILFASGGMVIYGPKEIKHKGLLKVLKANLFLEVLTQLDLIEYEDDINARARDFSEWLERINRRFRFPID